MMRLSQDYHQRVVIATASADWCASPMAGVERIMLERDGAEQARATSLVRYKPESYFSSHSHPGGEEIFVLQGTFADEFGRYPAGTYLRNPPGTHHRPFSEGGCIIFVKLRQFAPGDNQRLVINTGDHHWRPGLVPGLSVMPLHEFGGSHTALVKWQANTRFPSHRHWGGEEILVLEGVFRDEQGMYPKGSWIRSPHLSEHAPFTDTEGATILVKTGHLVE